MTFDSPRPGARPDATSVPEFADLVSDLRLLREKGLFQLRRMTFPALAAAATSIGLAADDPRALQTLLTMAVAQLGDEPGHAAEYLFGLVQGTSGLRTTELRRRAAEVFDLSAETFRKGREGRLIELVANEILRLCPSPEPPRAMKGDPARSPDKGADALLGPIGPPPPGAVTSCAPEVPFAELRINLAAALDDISRRAGAAGGYDLYASGRFGPFALPFGEHHAYVTVDLGAVEDLRDVDILVSSENVFLVPDRPFATTLSGQLRNAAALRTPTGIIEKDVVADELQEWVERNGRPGSPVEPGVVASTSAGQLTRNGVRRLFHPAVVVPRRGRHGYDVPSSGVASAIRGCFDLARGVRAQSAAENGTDFVTSFTIPLFGAGDGGLDTAGSLSRLWPAVRAELVQDPSWHVHITTWTAAEAIAVLETLIGYLNEVLASTSR